MAQEAKGAVFGDPDEVRVVNSLFLKRLVEPLNFLWLKT